MHAASRILFFLIQPSHFAILLIGLGLMLLFLGRAMRFGKVMAGLGLSLLLVLGFSPIGHLLLLPLEGRFQRGAIPVEGPAGIILLGGFEDGSISHARGALTLNESAERLTEAVVLARSYPDARIVFTGGVADLLPGGVAGAPAVGAYLEATGIAQDRIILEGRSRNTYENALFTRELVDPRPGERWLLVTSAWHMPRAMGAFRQARFDVVPWPVDYRTRGRQDFVRPFDAMTEGLRRTDMAIREWIGLTVYWLLGRTSAFFPGP